MGILLPSDESCSVCVKVEFIGSCIVYSQSNRCHLNKMSPTDLVTHGEHEDEWGGYFIVKGLERLVRMLVMTRRNYPIAVRRPIWKSRGDQFSELGVLLRSVRDDNTAIVCIYLALNRIFYQDLLTYFSLTFSVNIFIEQYTALRDQWKCKIRIYLQEVHVLCTLDTHVEVSEGRDRRIYLQYIDRRMRE